MTKSKQTERLSILRTKGRHESEKVVGLGEIGEERREIHGDNHENEEEKE